MADRHVVAAIAASLAICSFAVLAAGEQPGSAQVQATVSVNAVNPALTSPEVGARYQRAMEARDWVLAQQLAQRLTELSPKDPLAWYRRARAATFGGNGVDAADAIARAKDLDPRMSFTQDPKRVQALEAQIAALVTAAGPVASAAPAGPAVAAAAPEASAQPPSTPPADGQAPAAQAAASAPEAPVAMAAPAAAVVAMPAAPQAPQDQTAILAYGVLGTLLAIIIGLGVAHLVQLRKGNRRFASYLASIDQVYKELGQKHAVADVFEGMARTQKELHALRELLEAQGLTESELYAQITEFLPVLERNIGLAPMHELEMRGMNLGQLSEAEIAQRLMQTSRTGRYTMKVPVTVPPAEAAAAPAAAIGCAGAQPLPRYG